MTGEEREREGGERVSERERESEKERERERERALVFSPWSTVRVVLFGRREAVMVIKSPD